MEGAGFFRAKVAWSLYSVFPGLLGQFTLVTPWPTGRKHSLFRSDHLTRNALATQNNGALGRIIIVIIIIINIIIFLVLIKLYSILKTCT